MNALGKHASRGGTVLLAEDNETIRMMVKDMLKRQGYEVSAHPDGQQAYSFFQDSRDAVDLVVVDVVMPRLNGKELARKCRKQQPGIAILYMSSLIEGNPNVDEDLGGNADFIAKPFSAAELLRKVENLLDPESPED